MAHHHHHEHAHRHRSSNWWHRVRHAVRPHSHDAHDTIHTAEQASAAGIRASWISLAGMGATAVLQVAIVAISGSIALLADTLHNLGHLVTTIPLIIAFRIGRRPPTERYPFGYRRAEDLVGLLIAAVIAISAALIIWESIRALVDPRPLTNLGWVLVAGLVGAAGNEIVAAYRIRVGRRIGSAALVAEGHHARADGLTSLAVVIGALGVWLGMPRADAVIGLVIAGAILWILVQSSRTVLHRLMDGVEPDVLTTIASTAGDVPEVRHVDSVRARWIGHRLEAQLTISVDTSLTVGAGHLIAETVHQRLVGSVPHLDQTAIHVHPARLDARSSATAID